MSGPFRKRAPECPLHGASALPSRHVRPEIARGNTFPNL